MTADGPVQLVTAERVRLTQQIAHADEQTAMLERAMSALARQDNTHQAEHAAQQQVIAAADARATALRAEVAAPLIEQAATDAAAYFAARERMWEATAVRDTAGRLRKRAAHRLATATAGEHRATEDAVRRRWGGLPQSASGVRPWAEAVAHAQADTDPRVIAAHRQAEQTHRDQRHLAQRHTEESTALRRRLLGNLPSNTAEVRAVQWRTRAGRLRRARAEIEALPVTEAARVVVERTERERAHMDAAERALAAREARAANLPRGPSRSSDHRHGPATGYGIGR
ncbi:hypothetical protein [Georgenia yuyongxinii]